MPEELADGSDAIRRFIEMVNRGEHQRSLELLNDVCHPEVEFTPYTLGVEGRLHRGRRAVRAYFGELFETFEQFEYSDIEFRPISDSAVLLLVRLVARGRASGAFVEQEIGLVCEFDDALMRKGITYPSHTEAVAAAEALNA